MTNQLSALHATMRACRLCYDAGHDVVPGAVFSSGTDPKLLLIGQAPGVTEVEAKRPFNAGSGRRLFQWLGEAGWDETAFRARHYMTSVTKCYPGKTSSGRGDRVPDKHEQALCRPYLEQEIRLVNPRVIVPVGGLAIKLFFPAKYKLNQIIGTAHYFEPEIVAEHSGVVYDITLARPVDGVIEGFGRYIVPLPHPSGASLWPNKPQNQALINRAVQMLAALRTRLNL
ncbi:MAG: uracil-DNA glycosylase family protein [Anaerolineae bacterium]|nr:uracil-DNA glycosylase family protein [Anaerolineae bacterium]